jgi:hypothetical protein
MSHHKCVFNITQSWIPGGSGSQIDAAAVGAALQGTFLPFLRIYDCLPGVCVVQILEGGAILSPL